MRLRTRLLLACALWGAPVATLACNVTAASSYADVTQIYVLSDGLTAPVSVHGNVALDAGDCPESRKVLVWQQGDAMGGGPYCGRSPSGKLTICCGATTLPTDDPAAQIFARLLAVLERDRFYELAAARTPAFDQNQNGEQTAVVFEVAVLRCVPPPRSISIQFTGPPEPNPHTTVLRVAVPLGATPSSALDPDVVRLLDDVMHAVYQSRWYGQDIY
jgi:hypothetical protein